MHIHVNIIKLIQNSLVIRNQLIYKFDLPYTGVHTEDSAQVRITMVCEQIKLALKAYHKNNVFVHEMHTETFIHKGSYQRELTKSVLQRERSDTKYVIVLHLEQ